MVVNWSMFVQKKLNLFLIKFIPAFSFLKVVGGFYIMCKRSKMDTKKSDTSGVDHRQTWRLMERKFRNYFTREFFRLTPSNRHSNTSPL